MKIIMILFAFSCLCSGCFHPHTLPRPVAPQDRYWGEVIIVKDEDAPPPIDFTNVYGFTSSEYIYGEDSLISFLNSYSDDKSLVILKRRDGVKSNFIQHVGIHVDTLGNLVEVRPYAEGCKKCEKVALKIVRNLKFVPASNLDSGQLRPSEDYRTLSIRFFILK